MGNNSVPKFIFRLSRFPVYRGFVLGRFYCTTYCELIYVAIVNQHAMRMRHIVTYGLPRSTIFFYISHKRHDFRKKKCWIQSVCFDFLYKFFRNISHSKNSWARYDQKCSLVFMQSTRYFRPILMKLEFSRQFFEKHTNIKFHENTSTGSRVVPCGETDRRRGLTKLIVAFRNFSNAPKNRQTDRQSVRDKSGMEEDYWKPRSTMDGLQYVRKRMPSNS